MAATINEVLQRLCQSHRTFYCNREALALGLAQQQLQLMLLVLTFEIQFPPRFQIRTCIYRHYLNYPESCIWSEEDLIKSNMRVELS